jgi:PilZ domain
MENQNTRRSERIYVEVPVRVSGTDTWGVAFADDTKTKSINRHGAKVILKRALGPQQEVTICYLATGAETSARVVGRFGEDERGFHYGVEFLDVKSSIWGVEFPLAESENAAARILLECGQCHSREIVYLSEMEVQVFEANHGLTRTCKSCGKSSIWNEARLVETAEPVQPAAPSPPSEVVAERPRTQNDRKHARVKVKMTCCIRHPQFGEEILTPENISRGGLCFISRKLYGVGTNIETALPYTKEGNSIFSQARIVQVKEMPNSGGYRYGVQYIANRQQAPEDVNIRMISPEK